MDREVLKKAFQIVWINGKGWLLLTLVSNILLGITPLIVLWLSKELINSVLELIQNKNPENYQHIIVLIAGQFAVTSTNSIIKHFKDYYDKVFSIKLDQIIQESVLTKISEIPLNIFEKQDFYNHLVRINGSQGGRFIAPINQLLEILKVSINIVGFLFFLYQVHFALVIFSFIAAIPMYILNKKLGTRGFLIKYHNTPAGRELEYIVHLFKDRQTTKEIRVYNLTQYLKEKWKTRFQEVVKDTIKLIKMNQATKLGTETISTLTYSVASLLIVHITSSKRLTIGDFVAVGQAVQGLQNLFNQISLLFANIHNEMLYIKDLFDFLEIRTGTDTNEAEAIDFDIGVLKNEINIINLSFKYDPNGRDILKNINLKIKKGEKIAVVGSNGSGKTTFAKCITGLYPIETGKVFLDGIDINKIKPGSLYKMFSIIFQDFNRYAYSVYENIGYGDVEKVGDYEDIERIARLCGIDSFIQNFKEKYHTRLGKRLFDGEDLSGGQWQKIALSRAMFKGSEIVILDEPTSALDPISEKNIFEEFNKMFSNKTVIFISHRLSSIKFADRIIVLKDGCLIEEGTHDELIGNKNEYYNLYHSQAEWYTSKVMSQR
ncbi:ABC transporter ATP-binding protein [Brevibacillus brevis]|uniref:ABC transporter ATP-binding protein n=1 Tax=Brevibacillus brevis TaxID=1393 RepID=UPI001C8D7BFA|nr:ABC transporter ATP-binding protein [Brevibacillus brevis]MBY0089036.1 ABC transporter ATP-binding protein [Brevibacillus brevis]